MILFQHKTKAARNFILKKIILGLFLCVAAAMPAFANGLAISNLAVASVSTSTDIVNVQFDITWNNSWRDTVNFDAAWVFVKYSTDGGTTWNHATMKTSGTNPSGVSIGSGTPIEIVVTQDKKGAFIERSGQGSGTLTATSVQLVWDYASDGVSDTNANATTTVFKVIGLEMVYVTQGGYYLGDTGTATSIAPFQFGGSTSAKPAAINSEAGLSFGTSTVAGTQQIYYLSDPGTNDFASGTQFEVDASFPKGYQAFYCMKYEIAEQDYVTFLNTLTRVQQARRVAATLGDTIANTFVLSNSASSTNRNTVQAPASGNGTATTIPIVFYTTRPDRACSFLSWLDVAAYLDWAALRPMTELEFEKAARGPLYPSAANEAAWGATTGTACAAVSGAESAGTETCATAGAMAAYGPTAIVGGDATTGPLRAGIFATSSTVTRDTTGASYWGIMELSGNLYEAVVTVGATQGLAFSGTHGDGVLTTFSTFEGNATNLDWPGMESPISHGINLATPTGTGQRGGSWNDALADISISGRKKAGTAITARANTSGGRGVRTASA